MRIIGFIGCGNMGGALAEAVGRVNGVSLLLFDKDLSRADTLSKKITADVKVLDTLDGIAECDVVFLGVKPHLVREVSYEIKDIMKTGALLVSMAAGVSCESIQGYGIKNPIIRIMPNTPVLYGKGVVLYTVLGASESDKALFLDIMSETGVVDELPERLIDAASAVSGCGPAFVYMFLEAMADGAVAAGLPRDKALCYAANTAIGAAYTLIKSGKHPGELKDAVCSPGGSTIEGVMALENGGMRGVVSDAVVAAYEKTKKLGK